MALIRVKNNHTGDEGRVDEAWLERWPDDFAPLADEAPALPEQTPSTGTNDEDH